MYVADKCDFCRCGEYNTFTEARGMGWIEVAQAGVMGGHPDNTFSEAFQAGKMYALTVDTPTGVNPTSTDSISVNLPAGGTFNQSASTGGCVWVHHTDEVLNTSNAVRPTNYASRMYGLQGVEFTAQMSGACFTGFPNNTGAFSGVIAVWHDSTWIKPAAASGLFGHWIGCAQGDAISGAASFNCVMRIYEWRSPTRFYISNANPKQIKGIRCNARAHTSGGSYTELMEADHHFANPIEAQTGLCAEYLRPEENVVIPWALAVDGLLAGQVAGLPSDANRCQTVSPIFTDDTVGSEVTVTPNAFGMWREPYWPFTDCLCLQF